MMRPIVAILASSLVFQSTMYSININGHEKGERYMKETSEEEISLTEDLMREHGVLSRLLLIYEEISLRVEHDENVLKILDQAASIIQDFIQNYHEKLEEDYVFPPFEKHKKQVHLVKTLRKQHTRGRLITSKLKQIAHINGLLDKKTKKLTTNLITKFVRMYRPHKAREDTILFPQIRSLISKKEYKELGEIFEDTEHELFGEKGFFSIVSKVEILEKKLGIYNLEQFTP